MKRIAKKLNIVYNEAKAVTFKERYVINYENIIFGDRRGRYKAGNI